MGAYSVPGVVLVGPREKSYAVIANYITSSHVKLFPRVVKKYENRLGIQGKAAARPNRSVRINFKEESESWSSKAERRLSWVSTLLDSPQNNLSR